MTGNHREILDLDSHIRLEFHKDYSGYRVGDQEEGGAWVRHTSKKAAIVIQMR